MDSSLRGLEEKTMVLAFKKSGSGRDEPLETTVAAIHDQGYKTIDDFAKAQDLRIASLEEVRIHFKDRAGHASAMLEHYWSQTDGPAEDPAASLRTVRPEPRRPG